jgi:hypothetical protein
MGQAVVAPFLDDDQLLLDFVAFALVDAMDVRPFRHGFDTSYNQKRLSSDVLVRNLKLLQSCRRYCILLCGACCSTAVTASIRFSSSRR